MLYCSLTNLRGQFACEVFLPQFRERSSSEREHICNKTRSVTKIINKINFSTEKKKSHKISPKILKYFDSLIAYIWIII